MIKNGISSADDDYFLVAEGRQGRVLHVADRLTPSDIQVMIDAYLNGSTSRELALKYGFSQTTIKRILREHGARKYSRRSA